MTTSRLIGLLGGATLLAASTHVFAAIMGTTLGTSAAPADWAELPFTPFPAEQRATGQMVKEVVSPQGDVVVFECKNFRDQDKREKREVAQPDFNGRNWGRGYSGVVYHDLNFTPVMSLTLVLPPGTTGFSFFVQPTAPESHAFTVTAGTDATVVDPNVDGAAGASGFLFWSPDGAYIPSITIDSDVTFAVGEFAIARADVPEPSCLVLLGVTGMLLTRRTRKS